MGHCARTLWVCLIVALACLEGLQTVQAFVFHLPTCPARDLTASCARDFRVAAQAVPIRPAKTVVGADEAHDGSVEQRRINSILVENGDDSEALLGLVASYGAQFNAVNCATALHRLARCSFRTRNRRPLSADSRFRSLLVVTTSQLSSADPSALVTILLSLARMREISLPMMKDMCAQLAPVLPVLAPHDVSRVVGALAKFSSGVNGAFVEALGRAVDETVHDMAPGDLANVVAGWARLKQRPPHALVVKLLEAVADILEEFNPQDLAMTINGFAKFSPPPSSSWLSTFASEVESKVSLFNPRDLAMTMHSLTRLGHITSASLLARVEARAMDQLQHFSSQDLSSLLHAFSRSRRPVSPLLLSSLADAAINTLPTAGAQDFSVTLAALVRLGYTADDVAMGVIEERALVLLPSMGPQYLTSTLAALVKVLPRSLSPAVWTTGLCTARKLVEGFNAQDLSLLLSILNKAGMPPHGPTDLMDALLAQVEQTVDSFNAQDLSATFTTLGQLERFPGADLMRRLSHRTALLADQLDGRGLPSVLNAMANLGHRPPPKVMAKLQAALGRKANELSGQGLANAARAMAVLHEPPKPEFWEMVGRVVAAGGLNVFDLASILRSLTMLVRRPDEHVELTTGMMKRIAYALESGAGGEEGTIGKRLDRESYRGLLQVALSLELGLLDIGSADDAQTLTERFIKLAREAWGREVEQMDPQYGSSLAMEQVIACLKGMGITASQAPPESGFASVIIARGDGGKGSKAVALDVEKALQYMKQPHVPGGDIVFRRRLMRALVERGDYEGATSIVPSEWRTARAKGTATGVAKELKMLAPIEQPPEVDQAQQGGLLETEHMTALQHLNSAQAEVIAAELEPAVATDGTSEIPKGVVVGTVNVGLEVGSEGRGNLPEGAHSLVNHIVLPCESVEVPLVQVTFREPMDGVEAAGESLALQTEEGSPVEKVDDVMEQLAAVERREEKREEPAAAAKGTPEVAESSEESSGVDVAETVRPPPKKSRRRSPSVLGGNEFGRGHAPLKKRPRRTSDRALLDENMTIAVERMSRGGADSGADPKVPVQKSLENLCACLTCGQYGDLTGCESCPRSFHPSCVEEGTGQADGQLVCPRCVAGVDRSHLQTFYKGHVSGAAAAMLGPEAVKQLCMAFLKHLMDHDLARDFNHPIDVSYKDYYRVIENPIDLGTILSCLEAPEGQAEDEPFSLPAFITDMRNVFHNCRVFNEPTSGIGRTGELLSGMLEDFVGHLSPVLTAEQASDLVSLQLQRGMRDPALLRLHRASFQSPSSAPCLVNGCGPNGLSMSSSSGASTPSSQSFMTDLFYAQAAQAFFLYPQQEFASSRHPQPEQPRKQQRGSGRSSPSPAALVKKPSMTGSTPCCVVLDPPPTSLHLACALSCDMVTVSRPTLILPIWNPEQRTCLMVATRMEDRQVLFRLCDGKRPVVRVLGRKDHVRRFAKDGPSVHEEAWRIMLASLAGPEGEAFRQSLGEHPLHKCFCSYPQCGRAFTEQHDLITHTRQHGPLDPPFAARLSSNAVPMPTYIQRYTSL